MLIGQVLEFENEVDGNTETCSALVKNFCDKLTGILIDYEEIFELNMYTRNVALDSAPFCHFWTSLIL